MMIDDVVIFLVRFFPTISSSFRSDFFVRRGLSRFIKYTFFCFCLADNAFILFVDEGQGAVGG